MKNGTIRQMKHSIEYFKTTAAILESQRRFLKQQQQESLVAFQTAQDEKNKRKTNMIRKRIYELNGRILSFIREVDKFECLKNKFEKGK